MSYDSMCGMLVHGGVVCWYFTDSSFFCSDIICFVYSYLVLSTLTYYNSLYHKFSENILISPALPLLYHLYGKIKQHGPQFKF